jgi:3',5'-cyclic-AMP phosphodiesterase
MDTDRRKYIWLTDTHIKIYGRYKLLNTILDQNPYGVFLTGDISEGFSFLHDLRFLGERIGRPLYFVHGNHELWGSSFKKVHEGIRKLCAEYKNLIWMTDNGIIPLNDQTAIIGNEGWYDCRVGNQEYIKYTLDWWMTQEFRELPSMSDRIQKMQQLSSESVQLLVPKLEQALETYKVVYLLTHFPTHKEGNRASGLLSEAFWAPYNCNSVLGSALEKVMERHKNRHLCVLSGHVHQSMTVQVARNFECRVGKGSYYKISDEDIIYI